MIPAKKSRNLYAGMPDIEKVVIAGIKWSGGHLWVAASGERFVATHSPSTGVTEKRLTYPHEIWDLCPGADGLWLMTGGGKLGRQLVLWSLERSEELHKFNCPDGAGAGVTLYSGKLWVTHRHNRKLFCLDSQDGKVNWVIRTENETFSPAAYGNELWLVEADPGPLGHWDETEQGRYFFSRYDPARERIVERRPVPFIPHCMAFDGARFWYAERGKKGLSSMPKNSGQS